jgi:hypothetical protein
MKKNYEVLRNVLSKEKCKFLTDYFLLKRQVSRFYFDTAFISQFNKEYGIWNDPQCLGAWSHYGDIAGDLILQELKPVMEKKFKNKLYETYSYVRIYEKDHELKRHKDRPSCEISATLNLGGELWPIYIENDPSKGFHDENKIYISGNTKGDKVILKPGDMLLYKGDKLEHWREPLKEGTCIQMFLHYVEKNGKLKNNIYDGRPFLGIDSSIKRKG